MNKRLIWVDGDKFTATVNSAIPASNGVTIPSGAKAVIEVSQLKESGKTGDAIQMTFNVQSLSWGDKSYPIDATIDHVDVEKVRNASTKSDVAKVGGGAVIGGIIGQIIGHSTKGVVIGAATGAAVASRSALTASASSPGAATSSGAWTTAARGDAATPGRPRSSRRPGRRSSPTSSPGGWSPTRRRTPS